MKKRYIGRFLRQFLYWSLPPAILYLIFSRIDIDKLIEITAKADPLLTTIGLLFIVFKILPGALRWYWLTQGYDCLRLTFKQSLAEYWSSLTLGIIVPGSLGSDAYRIALSGRQTGFYLRGAFVIGVEKVAALFSIAGIIVGFYPLLVIEKLPDTLLYILDLAYYFVTAAISVILLAAITHKVNWFGKMIDNFVARIFRLAKNVKNKVKASEASEIESVSGSTPSELIYRVFRPKLLAPTILLSFIIHVIGAMQGQIFFQALGYDLPFIVNLFVGPLIMLSLTLPISFVGIGVREGAFILFYGLFGVPAEIALVVSYLALVSQLIAHIIGSAMIVVRRRYKPVLQESLQNNK